MLVIILVSLSACKQSHRYSDPEKAFQEIRLDFLHGHLAQAQEEAEKGYQQFSAKGPEWAWRFRLLKAEILINRGLSQDALSLLAPQFPDGLKKIDLQIKKFLLLGLAHMPLGDLAVSDENLAQAEQLCGSAQTELTAEVIAARGILEVRNGRPQVAEGFFRKTLRLAHEKNYQFVEAAALLNLSFAAVHQRHYDDAIDWANRAYELAHAIDEGLTEEKALGNQGWSYYQMGDLNHSLALSIEAEKRARDLGIIKDEIRWLYNSGVVYEAQGRLTAAQECHQKALDLARQIKDSEQATDALSSLSIVSIKQQRFDLAKQYSQQTFDLAHSRGDRSMELYALLEKGQIAVKEQRDKEAEPILIEVVKDRETSPPLRWMAQSELAHLYEQKNGAEAAKNQYQAALNTLECARISVGLEEYRLSFLTFGGEIYDDYIHFLVGQGHTDTALQTAEYSRAQTLAEGLGLLKKQQSCTGQFKATVNPQEAARQAGGAVLFYWLGQQQSFLWVVTAQQTSLLKLAPAAEIEALVRNYRQALLAPPDVLQTRNQDGIKLYELLVAPAQKFIPSGSRVTIIADGILNNLNFETLLVPSPKLHYLIEDVILTNASSLRMLAASRRTSNQSRGKLLLIGDPVVPDAKFPPLPSAKVEMQNIEKHFLPEARQIFSGIEANPTSFFTSNLGSFSYIHFVAHGTASQLSPLDSAVILSKATAEEDSYKLHARDIINHPLHAELAVISTCYGSGTTLYNGEGLVGLSWAFLRAGTHNVIGALWAVSDTSTPKLMDQLYTELGKGRSPQDALRAAKLTLLHSESTFRKPIYWAPFQLYTGS